MIFILLPILCFAAPECKLNGTDYSFMTKKDNYYKYKGEQGNFNFTMNICGTINSDGDSVVGQYTHGEGRYISMGQYETQTAVEKNGLFGFNYTVNSESNPWSTVLFIKCNETMENITITVYGSDLDKYQIGFLFEGKDCCPQFQPQKNDTDKPKDPTKPTSAAFGLINKSWFIGFILIFVIVSLLS